ncbi:MAG: helix-hairpin-helix domain-containing protein [Firmicutes bacterium]|nr:helix-hairpin-helix domain-containing protein [Bacillota bacterium]
MELTFKQKVIVFSVMLGIFLVSVIIKYGMDIGGQDETDEMVESASYQEDMVYQEQEINEENAIMIIDVEGAVSYPGIVKIREGSRVYEAVEEAGGLLDTADTKYVNLAEEVTDGSIIYIPFKEEVSKDMTEDAAGSKVNINTAGKEDLMKLPGIGESYAEAIIEYRNTNGTFKANEDVMNVTGIGEAKYENIKDMICVY